MSDYHPPVKDMAFLLFHVLGFKNEALDRDTVDAVLGEAAKLSSEVLAPLNSIGDKHGTKLNNGSVSTAPGFKEAYSEYCEGGWNSVPFDENYGGQGLPWALAFPIQEMWQGANLSFGLCPLLNQGATEAVSIHGSKEQKEFYLPKLISGDWTGTMHLTESQAGSDLGEIKTKAKKQNDGTYKVSGQKIFITYGEHDMTDNIIHFVLARTPDAPAGIKGISLFIVPKFLEDGTRNDVVCTGIEHKLGINASPTCTMQFGDNGGAVGYMLGQEHQGIKYMFTMMNNARLSVGLQGVAVAERSYQHALSYAHERVQGNSFETGERVPIFQHPDIQRMLLSMRSMVEAGRALTYGAALALDGAMAGDVEAQSRVDIMTPIVKAWCTDMACEVTSTGIQIHGGMGFIEETGAAQYYRDARILPIYEGTNGIQAADLAFRKVLRDGGQAARSYIDNLENEVAETDRKIFADSFAGLSKATDYLVNCGADKNYSLVAASASPYLKAFGIIAGGALLSKSAHATNDIEDKAFAAEKIKTAGFFLHNILPVAGGLLKSCTDGSKYI